MLPFPSLLRRAWQTCNRFSAPIALVTVAAGIILLLARTAMWGSLSAEFLSQTKSVLGESGYAEMERRVEAGDSVEQVSQFVMNELAIKVGDMPEEEQEPYVLSLMMGSVRRVAPVAVPLALVLLIVQIFVRTSFLVIAARKVQNIGEVLSQGAKAFFPVFGAWAGMWLCAGIWVPLAVFLLGFVWPPVLYLAVPSFAPLIVFLPRFLLAPVIVVAEKKSVVASLRASYERTTGRWWDVLSAVLAVEAVLWVVLTLISSLLTSLVNAVANFSVLGYALYWLMPFIALIAVAYRQAFLVEVKSAIKQINN